MKAKIGICSKFIMFLATGFFSLVYSGSAWATDLSQVSENIVESNELLPGLISGLAYLLALLFGVIGIIKAREHVENPNRAGMKDFIAPLIAGGTLFALPFLYEAMRMTIGEEDYDIQDSSLTWFTGLIGSITGAIPTQDFNAVMSNIVDSLETVPGLMSAAAYLLGLVLGVMGVIKLKEHVEKPDQVMLKEGVIRLLAGGALFSLTTIISAMITTIRGDGQSAGDYLTQFLAWGGLVFSMEAQEVSCIPGAGLFQQTIGSVACAVMYHTAVFPAFLAAFSYLAGVALAIWAILKTKEHVLNPDRVSIWEPVSRFIAGGALMALPTLMNAAANTVAFGQLPHTNTGFNEFGNGLLGPILPGVGGAGGLDEVVSSLMEDTLGPMTILFTWFSICAGMVLVVIAIFRVMKSAQEGVRGPGGIGTLMTFLVGGALISLNPMIAAISASMFTNPVTYTYATLQYTDGMTADEVAHVHRVISAVLAFMIVVGWVSIIRGFFILREVAEGGQQASMMAAVTHLIGGGLAVNLGPLLNAVQVTLGIQAYGIDFS